MEHLLVATDHCQGLSHDGWLGVHAEQHMRTVRGDIAARPAPPWRGARAGPSARGGPASAILTAFATHEMTKKDA